MVRKIADKTKAIFNEKTSDDYIIEMAQTRAKEMITVKMEDSTFQLTEIEEYFSKPNAKEEVAERKFSLYKEFKDLESVKLTEDADFINAVIVNMDDKEKMRTSIKSDVFKGSLKYLGLDMSKQKINDFINESISRSFI